MPVQVFSVLTHKWYGGGESVMPLVGPEDRCERRKACQQPSVVAPQFKWVLEQGGWTTAKLLLDTYGHFMPSESRGFSDANAAPDGPRWRWEQGGIRAGAPGTPEAPGAAAVHQASGTLLPPPR
jgi:hypothetical protein